MGIYSFDVTNKKLEERHITISFEPTVQPKKAESNRRFYKCPTCTGSGNSFMVCPGCGGAGYNSKATLVYRQGGTDKCVYCKGSGRYPVASCGTCHGTGEVYQDRYGLINSKENKYEKFFDYSIVSSQFY